MANREDDRSREEDLGRRTDEDIISNADEGDEDFEDMDDLEADEEEDIEQEE